MTKIVGLEDVTSGGELQQEIQQSGKDVTQELLACMTSAAQKTG